MITPCNFSICASTIWILDTGSLINICNLLQGLRSVGDLKKTRDFLMLEMEDKFQF